MRIHSDRIVPRLREVDVDVRSTVCITYMEQTFVLPVKERSLTLLSRAMVSPMSAPPHTVVDTAAGRLLAASTP